MDGIDDDSTIRRTPAIISAEHLLKNECSSLKSLFVLRRSARAILSESQPLNYTNILPYRLSKISYNLSFKKLEKNIAPSLFR